MTVKCELCRREIPAGQTARVIETRDVEIVDTPTRVYTPRAPRTDDLVCSDCWAHIGQAMNAQTHEGHQA